MQIELRPEDARYVKQRMKSGQFKDPSEVVHGALHAIRQLRNHLDAELLKGINSGEPTPLADDWKQNVRSRAAQRLKALAQTIGDA